jgi:hypothetical protein
MADDPLTHPMVREIQATIRVLEEAVTCQEGEIARLALLKQDTKRDHEILETVTSTLIVLKARLAMIKAAISSAQEPD